MNRTSLVVLLAVMLALSPICDARRTISKSRGGSSSSSSRRTSSSGGVTKPTFQQSSNSHADLAKLSYGSNYNSQPNRGSGLSSHSQPSAPNPPIGWNVPKAQGPPPAYSAHNPVGGAKTNIHEPAPAYKPNNAAPPAYPHSASNYPQQPAHNPSSGSNYPGSYGAGVGTGAVASHHGTAYRPRSNGTGAGGFSPITSTNVHGVQSGYPQQSLPAGATYHPAGSVPAGAHYYPAGSIPAGASYHPAGGMPAGASYHPAGGLPAGASYHPAGQVPAGATYYPSGGYPGGVPQSPPVYQGAGVQPGYYPSGSFPQKSSGPGLGTGLIAGALGGAILGHVLTPTHTQTVQHAPVAAAGSADSGDKDRIIIINNGPPGSVTTNSDGTTIINANSGAPVMPAAGAAGTAGVMAPVAPVQPGMAPAETVPLAPFANNLTGPPTGVAAANPGETPAGATNSGDIVPLAPFAAGTPNTAAVPPPADGAANPDAPPAGGVICVPVMVDVPSPNDTSVMTKVEQIACYNVPAPPPGSDPNAPMQQGAAVPPPENQPQQQPDLMKMPGNVAPDGAQKASTASLPENSQIRTAHSKANSLSSVFTIFTTIIVAYCMH